MKFHYFLFLFFVFTSAFSQDFEISGELVEEEGITLESATLYAKKVTNISLIC